MGSTSEKVKVPRAMSRRRERNERSEEVEVVLIGGRSC